MREQEKRISEEEQRQNLTDNCTPEERIVKKQFLEHLELWRKDMKKALGTGMLYDKLSKNSKMHKDISVALMLGSVDVTVVKRPLQDCVYPEHLRRIATILICLPVSSARVERVFSQLKLLYSKRRLSLNPECVKQLMFLGLNKCIPSFTARNFNFANSGSG